MAEQPPNEETFRRPFSDRATGCLVYVVIVPFIAFFLTIPFLLGLQALGASEEFVFRSLCVLFPLLLIAFAIRGYREYHERANIGVRVQGDRIVSWAGSRVQEFEFSDVRSVRIKPKGLNYACVLTLSDGISTTLTPEITPVQDFWGALEKTLVPRLRDDLEVRLHSGEIIPLGLPATRLVSTSLLGLIEYGGTAFLLISPFHWLLAYQMFCHATLLLRQGWYGLASQKMEIAHDGLYPQGIDDKTFIIWRRLEIVVDGLGGMLILADDGRRYRISALLDNYGPLRSWIRSRIPRT